VSFRKSRRRRPVFGGAFRYRNKCALGKIGNQEGMEKIGKA
jgi:hypothetical protein